MKTYLHNFLIKQNMVFEKLNNVINVFPTILLIKNKTPVGETGCLSNLYYLLAAQAPSFLIHSLFQNTVS